MDEKMRALVETALTERFELAFLAMKEECCAYATAVQRLVELSNEIEHHLGISDDARAVQQEFLSLDADNNAQFQKYLYIQGAKDCAAVLRELGLIK